MLVNTSFQIITREGSVMYIFIGIASCIDILLLNMKPKKYSDKDSNTINEKIKEKS